MLALRWEEVIQKALGQWLFIPLQSLVQTLERSMQRPMKLFHKGGITTGKGLSARNDAYFDVLANSDVFCIAHTHGRLQVGTRPCSRSGIRSANNATTAHHHFPSKTPVKVKQVKDLSLKMETHIQAILRIAVIIPMDADNGSTIMDQRAETRSSFLTDF